MTSTERITRSQAIRERHLGYRTAALIERHRKEFGSYPGDMAYATKRGYTNFEAEQDGYLTMVANYPSTS